LQETCQNLLRARLGVELAVVLAQPGEIKDLTGIESRQKPMRLIDRR
jgi:phenylacetate-CoA ligase